jgi:hypothetical protein
MSNGVGGARAEGRTLRLGRDASHRRTSNHLVEAQPGRRIVSGSAAHPIAQLLSQTRLDSVDRLDNSNLLTWLNATTRHLVDDSSRSLKVRRLQQAVRASHISNLDITNGKLIICWTSSPFGSSGQDIAATMVRQVGIARSEQGSRKSRQ